MTKHLIALLVLLKAMSAFAAPVPVPLPSNFIQKITFNLTVVTPGKTTTKGTSSITTVSNLALTTPFVLEALGAVTSNHFSVKAQIVCVNPIIYDTFTNTTTNAGKIVTTVNTYGYLVGTPKFEIRDGANIVDVTEFFSVNNVTQPFAQPYIASSTTAKPFDYTAFKSYRVRTITVSNAALGFAGQGFVESPLVSVTVRPSVVVFGNNDDWTSFSGIANNGVISGILQGTISATYEKVE